MVVRRPTQRRQSANTTRIEVSPDAGVDVIIPGGLIRDRLCLLDLARLPLLLGEAAHGVVLSLPRLRTHIIWEIVKMKKPIKLENSLVR